MLDTLMNLSSCYENICYFAYNGAIVIIIGCWPGKADAKQRAIWDVMTKIHIGS